MWILITLAATTFQIVRTSEQHRLRERLDVFEAGSVRYLYALPLALTVLAVRSRTWPAFPELPASYFAIVVLAGLGQIGGTIALLQSFRTRDFAVGTVYAKAEVVLVAIASAVLLDEPPSTAGWIGVLVVFVGIIWLASDRIDANSPGNDGPMAMLRRAADPAAALGVVAGCLFALTSVGIRAASELVLEGSDQQLGDFDAALVTLAGMLLTQSVLNGLGLALAPGSSLRTVGGAWRTAAPVGLLSLGGSACWAWAITIEGATKVRTLGQIELVLAFVIGITVHREEHRIGEYLASALIVLGILGIVVS